MVETTIKSLDKSMTKTLEWINDLSEDIGYTDKQHTYLVLKSVLHALRDRLTIEEATDLAAQLPLVIKGIYYDEYNPSKTPIKAKNEEEFYAMVDRGLKNNPEISSEQITPIVLGFLARRIGGDEIVHVISNLPPKIAALWVK
ncbi:MAG: DUF2267 domain-containing protein [Nanoarchaeota archaeon]